MNNNEKTLEKLSSILYTVKKVNIDFNERRKQWTNTK